jgi:AcrR family transcriptional regulator
MIKQKGPSLRLEQQQATRRRLIEATIEVISTRGYQAATIDNIVSHASTGRATFYLHFKSKGEALLAGWEELQLPHIVQLLLEIDEMTNQSEGDIRSWVDRMIHFWETNRNIAIASNQAISVDPEMAAEWFRRIWTLGLRLPRWKLRNNDAIGDAQLRFFMLSAETANILSMWVMNAAPMTRDTIVDVLVVRWGKEFGG